MVIAVVIRDALIIIFKNRQVPRGTYVPKGMQIRRTYLLRVRHESSPPEKTRYYFASETMPSSVATYQTIVLDKGTLKISSPSAAPALPIKEGFWQNDHEFRAECVTLPKPPHPCPIQSASFRAALLSMPAGAQRQCMRRNRIRTRTRT